MIRGFTLSSRGRSARRAFSLIEVVVVVVLIGIIASIAVGRMGRVAQRAEEAAVKRNLDLMQRAIDLYAQEHEGTYPAADKIEEQLTTFSNVAGDVSDAKLPPYIYGPYVKQIPKLSTGPMRGSNTIDGAPGPGVAWVYSPTEGTIRANTTGGGVSGGNDDIE